MRAVPRAPDNCARREQRQAGRVSMSSELICAACLCRGIADSCCHTWRARSELTMHSVRTSAERCQYARYACIAVGAIGHSANSLALSASIDAKMQQPTAAMRCRPPGSRIHCAESAICNITMLVVLSSPSVTVCPSPLCVWIARRTYRRR